MKYTLLLLIISLAASMHSCTPKPYAATNKKYKERAKQLASGLIKIPVDSIVADSLKYPEGFVGTTNFGLRKPNYVIIHHTAQNIWEQTLKTFTLERTQVSAHYVIANDGRVVQMVNDYLRAWHGGNAVWGRNTDINSASIGIELDNNGFKPFSENQIISLLALLTKLKKDYNIPTQNIIGHSDIAPSRKADPSKLFPWKLLALNSFGIWSDDILEPAPANFNVEQALRIIGYNTKNLASAISAFKLHYIQTEVDSVLNAKTINTIYNIYKKQ